MSDKDNKSSPLPSAVPSSGPSLRQEARIVSNKLLSIAYPSGLPYQIPADDSANGSTNPFSLYTKTVDGVGTAADVTLGPAGSINAWTVLFQLASVAKSGAETLYRMGTGQVTVISTGAAAGVVDEQTIGTQSNVFMGNAGKVIPSATIVDGLVILTFTPIGQAGLTLYSGVTGTIARAVPEGVTP